ncbi:MAG TPA: hypothetical protein VFH70_03580 [Acidimicrobiales bacterium]|nr:hypothetical protein [Acidimicrobiales bacterium]
MVVEEGADAVVVAGGLRAAVGRTATLEHAASAIANTVAAPIRPPR